MAENYKRKKSIEQKLWEQRKLKMAGIETEKVKENLYDENIEIEIREKYKSKTVNNVPEEIIDLKNPLFLIGNKPSLYFEQYRNLIKSYNPENLKSELNINKTSFDYKCLPVYKNKEEFLEVFATNSVILVTGETGCGKSTLIPKFIFDEYKSRICVTQPRIISVKSLYARMKYFYNKEVGYAVRFDQDTGSETKINYVTEGILLREISSDALLSKYDVIICDEVHERSINLDIILGFLKIIQTKRKDLKIILMSATLQIEEFKNYFDCYIYHFTGSQFPVIINYLKINVDDYIEWTVKKILKVHQKQEEGDILVFLSGKEDIFQVYNILKIDGSNDLEIIPLYSEIINEVYDRIFNNKSKNRKCILSTNIAEASVTIKNIKYVIDTGFQKISFYDYNQGERLIKYPISKQNAIQRTGRAGRTMPGICYRMYSEKSYKEDFCDSNIYDILRSNISNTILLILSTNYKQIEKFPFLTKPSTNFINAGIDTLLILGCIDMGYNITEDGSEILKFGIDIILGKLIIEGIKYDCSYDTTLLASILSLDTHNLFDHFLKLRDHPDYLKCIVSNNEFLTLINLFKWGYKNSLVAPCLIKKVKNIHENLIKRLLSLKYKVTYSKNIDIVILKTFFYNLCKKVDNEYFKLSTNVKYKLSNSDIDGKYIVYYKSFITKKNNLILQICCNVDPRDICKYLGDIFKDSNSFKETDSEFNTNIFEKLCDRFELDSDIEI